MSLQGVTPDRTLDVRGQVCPYPTVEMLKILNTMAEGELLEVVSDYMPSRYTIPQLCEQQRFPWEIVEDEGDQFRVLVKKEAASRALRSE